MNTLDRDSIPRKRRHKTVAMAAIVPLVALVAACGSSKSGTESGSAGQAAAPSGPQPTGSPIKVGEMVEVKGVGLNWAFQEAIDRAAVRGINARGGVNGHPIELEVCDGQNDPNIELQCARKLVSDGVVATVGGITTTNGAAVDAYFLQHKIAQIGTNPLVDDDFNNSNQFLLSSGQLGIFSGDVYNASKQGLKKIWVMTLNVPGADLGIKIAKETATASGISVVGSSKIPLTSTSDASYVQAAISGGADAVLPAMGATQTATLLLALKQAGSKLTLINIDSEPSSDIATACGSGGGICTGSIGSSFSLPPTYSANPGVKLFQQDMAAEVAAGDDAAKPGSAYNSLALQGWLGMQALAKVAAKLPTITAETVLDGFKTAKDIDLWDMIPAWTPNASAGIPGYPRISSPFVHLTTMHSDLLSYASDTKSYSVLELNPSLAKS